MHASMQVCKYASMQVYKYEGMSVCQKVISSGPAIVSHIYQEAKNRVSKQGMEFSKQNMEFLGARAPIGIARVPP